MKKISYRIQQVLETNSTNEDVKAAAERGEAEGFVVQAVRQTAGKGRHGRSWSSPEGNMYLSLLLRSVGPVSEVSGYAFVAALAVYDVVKAVLPNIKVELKWPNDVLVEGSKVSGILLESSFSQEGRAGWLVIGTGINVLHAPVSANYPATSLVDEGAEGLSVDKVVGLFLDHFEYWRSLLSEDGFSQVRAAWLERARKGHMTVRLTGETVGGEFEDVSEGGALILRLEDGSKRSISAGDVFFN